MESDGKMRIGRRAFIRGALMVGLAFVFARGLPRLAQAQTVPRVVAARVNRVPADPSAAEWSSAKVTTISMNPQTITIPRITEAGVKSLQVRALFDSERFGLLAEWVDPERNVGIGSVASFRDAFAFQFPSDLNQPKPSFAMGQPGNAVTIYQWKSDWQFASKYDVDEQYPNMEADHYPFSGVPAGRIPEATDYKEKGDLTYVTAWKAGNLLADLAHQATTSVEKLTAEGFGTLKTSVEQDGEAQGVMDQGLWRVVIAVPRVQKAFTLEQGQVLPLGFAVWDGSRGERNGRKAFSLWNELTLGESERISNTTLVGAAGAALALATGVAVVIWLRIRRSARVRGD